MKSVSLETKNLLQKLANSASWWQRLVTDTDAQAVHSQIEDLSPLDLAALDQKVRTDGSNRYEVDRRWYNLRPSDVGGFAKSRFAVSLVGLSSFHHSGYVREAAVKELSLQCNGKELPFLLIRLNDWVSQVRDSAANAVRARIEPAYAFHFLENFSLVLRLKSCGRVDHKFVDDICRLLKQPECKAVLESGMASDNKFIRRTSFQLAAEAEPSARMEIIRKAFADSDVVVRLWVARHFLPELASDELASVVEPMLNDRFMPVRRDALWFVAKKRPDLATQPLRRALLDSHISMRETARQFLDIAGVPDARVFYIEAIQHGGDKNLFAAICGLGETGSAADVKLLETWLISPLTKLRRASVCALGRLDVEGQLEKLVGFLSDEKTSVVREAMKALLSKARYIPLNDLERLLASNAGFYVRRSALTLILRADKWKKIPALLRACADKEIRLAELAARALRDWSSNYNSSFAEPKREDFERIQVALGKVEVKLPRGFAAELKTTLKIYFK